MEDDGGATVAEFHDKVVLFDGATPTASFELGTMNAGHIHEAVSYTHLRAHETVLDLVCRLLLEKKKTK